jgi:hypothetical protein
LEGVRGSSYSSDIAVDDLSIIPGPCPSPGSCDFESGFCSYTNVQQGDQFDWERGSGITPSFYTGPNNDHTTNSAQGNLSIPEMITTNSAQGNLSIPEMIT